MNKIKIDPSIFVVIDIGPVSFNEDLNIYFTADQNLSGVFEVKYFNSSQKNKQKTVLLNAITVVGQLLTFKIAPSIQALGTEDLYYEIWHQTTNRMFFKGQIIIIK
jgi:hypothetical protein